MVFRFIIGSTLLLYILLRKVNNNKVGLVKLTLLIIGVTLVYISLFMFWLFIALIGLVNLSPPVSAQTTGTVINVKPPILASEKRDVAREIEEEIHRLAGQTKEETRIPASKISVKYNVKNKEYTVDTTSTRVIHPGDSVWIHYNISNPTIIAITRRTYEEEFSHIIELIFFVSCCIPLVGGGFLIWSAFRKRNIRGF